MVTGELSHELSEQLRIILEPMLCAALKGDYRTGKRVNIKKIIPYIASQFRKDKIWLRRTKPNKRNYQVMIAIDDSLSMQDNGSGRLALEALTTLCQAMTQIEVGQLAVVNFGEQVRLLHPFDRPFTDQDGAYVASQFKFQQENTDWVCFLDAALKILEEAGQEHRDQDHLQLVFVISDGVLKSSREEVARRTREALDRGQLLVLLVVDSPDPKKSINHRQSASYAGGKLSMKHYLEGYPFPYYVVLRDIKALPEIVGDALRQWFELIHKSD
jgi:midasin